MKPQLQAFQIAMLQTEYGDFGSQPRFHDLVDFFFGALYAPADFGLRNESFRTLHEWLAGIVGHDPVRVLAQAIELHELTESLDDDMLLAMRAVGIDGNEAVSPRPLGSLPISGWVVVSTASGRPISSWTTARF